MRWESERVKVCGWSPGKLRKPCSWPEPLPSSRLYSAIVRPSLFPFLFALPHGGGASFGVYLGGRCPWDDRTAEIGAGTSRRTSSARGYPLRSSRTRPALAKGLIRQPAVPEATSPPTDLPRRPTIGPRSSVRISRCIWPGRSPLAWQPTGSASTRRRSTTERCAWRTTWARRLPCRRHPSRTWLGSSRISKTHPCPRSSRSTATMCMATAPSPPRRMRTRCTTDWTASSSSRHARMWSSSTSS